MKTKTPAVKASFVTVVANTLMMAAIIAGIAFAVLFFRSPSILGFLIIVPSALLAAQLAVMAGSGVFFVLSLFPRFFKGKPEEEKGAETA